jgi:hypothetical protein
MADLAHQRLIQTLLDASVERQAGDQAEVPTALAMSDAWSIVDYVHRLRNLLRHMPEVKHRDRIVEYRRFKRNSESVTTLRNSIQHLEGNFLATAADTGWAVFGTLTWAIPKVTTGVVRTGSLIPGSLDGARPASVAIGEKKIHLPVGLITLHQGTTEFPISVVMDDVAKLARMLEEVVGAAFHRLPDNLGSQRHAADILLVATLTPVVTIS